MNNLQLEFRQLNVKQQKDDEHTSIKVQDKKIKEQTKQIQKIEEKNLPEQKKLNNDQQQYNAKQSMPNASQKQFFAKPIQSTQPQIPKRKIEQQEEIPKKTEIDKIQKKINIKKIDDGNDSECYLDDYQSDQKKPESQQIMQIEENKEDIDTLIKNDFKMEIENPQPHMIKKTRQIKKLVYEKDKKGYTVTKEIIENEEYYEEIKPVKREAQKIIPEKPKNNNPQCITNFFKKK